MKLGAWLKQRRKSQKQFAAEVGASEATVSSWISGRTLPDVRKYPVIEAATAGAVRMADFLDASWIPASGQTGLQDRPPGLAEAQSPLLPEARALGLDPEAIAAAALKKAIGDEKARRWAEENRAAIEAHNRWVDQHGTLLAKYRHF